MLEAGSEKTGCSGFDDLAKNSLVTQAYRGGPGDALGDARHGDASLDMRSDILGDIEDHGIDIDFKSVLKPNDGHAFEDADMRGGNPDRAQMIECFRQVVCQRFHVLVENVHGRAFASQDFIWKENDVMYCHWKPMEEMWMAIFERHKC